MKYHLAQSVRGALSNWSEREMGRAFVDENGRHLKAHEAREYLFDCLTQGKELIPIDPSCDNFDFKDGCQGHDECTCSEINARHCPLHNEGESQ